MENWFARLSVRCEARFVELLGEATRRGMQLAACPAEEGERIAAGVEGVAARAVEGPRAADGMMDLRVEVHDGSFALTLRVPTVEGAEALAPGATVTQEGESTIVQMQGPAS